MQNKNIYKGSYICFAEAVIYQGFTKKIIAYWFHRIVPGDDYSKSDRKSLISHLVNLSNSTEERTK